MRVYNRAGVEIDSGKWAELVNDEEYRRIEITILGNSLVATSWLGLDFSAGEGPPLIFQSRSFPLGTRRFYPTEEDARRGHAELVKKLRESSVGLHEQ